MSRRGYLLSLFLAAWIPLLLYVSGFLISGLFLVSSVHGRINGLWQMALLQLAIGLWLAALSLLYSILLHYLLASLATMLTAALAAWTAMQLQWAGAGRLLVELPQIGLSPRGSAATPLDLLLTLLIAGVLFGLSCWIFERRDLNFSAE